MSVKFPTFRLSEEELEAAKTVAALENRNLGNYIRTLIHKDCQSRGIPIAAPRESGTQTRLESVAEARHRSRVLDEKTSDK